MKKIFALLSIITFFLSGFFFSSCETKEVDISTVDAIFGGESRKWKFKSYEYNGSDLLASSEYFIDDTIIFSREVNIDSGSVTNYYKYVWKKGVYLGGASDETVYADISFTNDFKEIYIGEFKWDILSAKVDELVIEHDKGGTNHHLIHYEPYEDEDNTETDSTSTN